MSKVEIEIFFDCPDCETGRMHKEKYGQIKNFFICNKCETSLLISPKLMKYLLIPYTTKASKAINFSINNLTLNSPSR